MDDPTSVRRVLRKFEPRGAHREKLKTLVNESVLIKIDNNPIGFALLLKCMLEISAKAFCKDHASRGGPKTIKDGRDKDLKDLLVEITAFLIAQQPDKPSQLVMKKLLHPAMAELATPTGCLSITSMNHLSHHLAFVVKAKDICPTFHHVFPLLQAMNK
jgi:hypothetical protein